MFFASIDYSRHSTYKNIEIRSSKTEYFTRYFKFYAKRYEHKMRNAHTFICKMTNRIIILCNKK